MTPDEAFSASLKFCSYLEIIGNRVRPCSVSRWLETETLNTQALALHEYEYSLCVLRTLNTNNELAFLICFFFSGYNRSDRFHAYNSLQLLTNNKSF